MIYSIEVTQRELTEHLRDVEMLHDVVNTCLRRYGESLSRMSRLSLYCPEINVLYASFEANKAETALRECRRSLHSLGEFLQTKTGAPETGGAA